MKKIHWGVLGTADIARNNYALEVEELGRCIRDGETPRVSREFSLRAARVTDRILQAIGY